MEFGTYKISLLFLVLFAIQSAVGDEYMVKDSTQFWYQKGKQAALRGRWIQTSLTAVGCLGGFAACSFINRNNASLQEQATKYGAILGASTVIGGAVGFGAGELISSKQLEPSDLLADSVNMKAYREGYKSYVLITVPILYRGFSTDGGIICILKSV